VNTKRTITEAFDRWKGTDWSGQTNDPGRTPPRSCACHEYGRPNCWNTADDIEGVGIKLAL